VSLAAFTAYRVFKGPAHARQRQTSHHNASRIVRSARFWIFRGALKVSVQGLGRTPRHQSFQWACGFSRRFHFNREGLLVAPRGGSHLPEALRTRPVDVDAWSDAISNPCTVTHFFVAFVSCKLVGRIISLRRANRHEVNHYVKATQEDQPEESDT
jgi:hypothetical protein